LQTDGRIAEINDLAIVLINQDIIGSMYDLTKLAYVLTPVNRKDA
jgi:hypothetical protein